jgi:hypothetical protein
VHLNPWLTTIVTAPRWFLATMVIGSSLFTAAMAYIAGHATGRR